jgi:methyl-accepting chemotaxis protein
MKLTDFKIKTRLAFGYSVIVLLLVILIVVGIFSISNMNDKLDRIVSVNNAKIRHSMEIKSALDDLTISMATILLSKDNNIKETQRKRIENDRVVYKKTMEELEKKEVNDEGINLILKLKEAIAAGKEANNRVLELSMAGNSDTATKLYEGVCRPTALKYSEAALAVIKYNENQSNIRSDEAKKSGEVTRIVFLSIGMAAVLLCVLLGFFISNSITKPISKGVDFAKKMSEGNLSQRLNIS